MGLIFVTDAPTEEDVDLFRRMLSTFRDGSGIERDADGSTRAGWRQIERCVAAMLNSIGGEDKGIFDVIALDSTNKKVAYGFSVKSKQLSKTEFEKLSTPDGQVYMEIANSPAKFWAEIQSKHGLKEQEFREQRFAEEIGSTVVDTVEKWHEEGRQEYEQENKGVALDLDKSCYFCLSYSKANTDDRQYRIDTFPLQYPKNITWRYKSESCLSGYVNEGEKETLIIDWYGLSGGQLKYYPKTTDSKYSTTAFRLEKPSQLEDLRVRANTIFPRAVKQS